MKTIASKYFDSSDMYDKPAMLLDILLVGKYGSKKINTLMKDFTNNMGVVTDQQQLELLADVVAAYYKDMWDKRYAALTVEYNMLEPYKLQTDSTTNETSTDSTTSVNTESSNSTSGNESTTTYDVKDKISPFTINCWLPLNIGENHVTIKATDKLGNQSRHTHTIKMVRVKDDTPDININNQIDIYN